MPGVEVGLLSALIFAAAVVYSAVGQAGATGYLAAMALFGLPPSIMRPTALTLNVLVAGLGTYKWNSAGLVSWKALLPLLITSVPASFIGGAIDLPGFWYRILVGGILALGALQMLFQAQVDQGEAKVPWIAGMIIGLVIGLLSGLSGTGGGIFLSPLLLFLGWADTRQSFGISAPFNLINSVAAVGGNVLVLEGLPPELPYFVVAALIGAVVGTNLSIKVLSRAGLQRVLAIILLIAAAKFLLV